MTLSQSTYAPSGLSVAVVERLTTFLVFLQLSQQDVDHPASLSQPAGRKQLLQAQLASAGMRPLRSRSCSLNHAA